MSKKIKFTSCDCQIEIGKFDINNISLNCPATWNLISSGFTTGIFQLESRLGQDWSKKVKPENIEELSALTALLRPGALESGQSDNYIDVKFGKKQISYAHQLLKPILEKTYGCLVYQEQAIKIASDIAGFSLEESDTLRKSIGKKDTKLMASLKDRFIEGCQKTNNVPKEVSEQIFGWIEKSQRYSFNKSHAVSYGLLSYQTAYVKTHFPVEFFASYLTYSDYKADSKEEVYKLVQDARLFGVDVLQPDIRQGNVHFEINNQEQIRFGLSHIRNVGSSAINKILEKGAGNLDSWNKFLKSVPLLHRNVGLALIQSGACDSYNLSRSRMVNELEILLGKTVRLEDGSKKEIKGLTDKEREWFFENWTEEKSIQSVLSEMVTIGLQSSSRPSNMKKDELIDFAKNALNNEDESLFIGKTKKDILSLIEASGFQAKNITKPCTKARISELEKKITQLNDNLEDTNTAKAIAEKYYLGIALSCSPADDVDNSIATHTCLDIAKCLDGQEISVCAIIDNVKPTKTKKGKNPGAKMCFLTISDSTYSIDHAVIFPDIFEEVSSLCIDGYICLINGYKKNGSFIINKMKKLI